MANGPCVNNRILLLFSILIVLWGQDNVVLSMQTLSVCLSLCMTVSPPPLSLSKSMNIKFCKMSKTETNPQIISMFVLCSVCCESAIKV